jgi:hypothetical protein
MPNAKPQRTATEQMATLVERRTRAEARVGLIDTEQRQATVTLTAMKEAVSEYHRRGGGRPAEQKQLEQQLREAQAEADLPWTERREGARRAVRDAHAQVQAFVAENLAELVQAHEADGQIVAARITAHAEKIVDDYAEWQRIGNDISALAALVGPVRPGDVTRSMPATDRLAQAARELVQEGGEVAPRLRHDPREPRYAQAEVEEPQPVIA